MIACEELLPFSQVAKQLQEHHGIKVHVSTLHRWREKGVRGRRLAAHRIGGRWFTTVRDVLTLQEGDPPPSSPPRLSRTLAAQALLKSQYGI